MNERLVAGAPVGARRARPAGGSPAGPDQQAQERLAALSRQGFAPPPMWSWRRRRSRAATGSSPCRTGWPSRSRRSPPVGTGRQTEPVHPRASARVRPVHEAVAAFLYQPWGLSGLCAPSVGPGSDL